MIERVLSDSLRSPWTSLRIIKNSRHWDITVWQDHGMAGTLTVDAHVGQVVVDQFLAGRPQMKL